MKPPETHQWTKERFVVSTDPSLLDLGKIHAFLSTSYWASEIPIELVKKSIRHSLNFGLYSSGDKRLHQIGFARVVTDHATFAYLGDVFVDEGWRGLGLSKWLMACVTSHPDLQGLRRFCLGTKDAHKLYKKFGFKVIQHPENWMEIRVLNAYKRR
jgi:GNAT superfamily N-acetyltransferase